jgi:two-component system response regulator RegX3
VPLDVEEYRLLDVLLQHAGRPVAPDALVEAVWPPGSGSRDLLKVYLRRLREKLEDDPDRPRLIRAVAGDGLVLDPLAAAPGTDTATRLDSRGDRDREELPCDARG